MFILKPKVTQSLETYEHWSMVNSKAEPNGKCLITMGLFKDDSTANDVTKCSNHAETIEVPVSIDPTVWSTPQAQPVALTIYQAMVAAPGGYFVGCQIGQ